MKEKITDFIDSVKENPKKIIPIVVVVFFIMFFVNGFKSYRAEGGYSDSGEEDGYSEGYEDDAYVPDVENQVTQATLASDEPISSPSEETTLTKQQLLDRQDRLSNIYGSLPEGYIWSDDGTVISMGDPNLSAEETLFAYLNGLRTLDFSSSQRFARNSKVIQRYDGFYNDTDSGNYNGAFFSSMYAEVLKSIQVKEVKDVSTFVETRQIINIELNLLDLSDKDFWRQDEDELFENLYMYQSTESDSIRGSQYLYEYILDHYKTGQVGRRSVELSFILEKDVSLGTGWLVTSDVDLDNYCYYTDGTMIVNYIRELYSSYGQEAVRKRLKGGED